MNDAENGRQEQGGDLRVRRQRGPWTRWTTEMRDTFFTHLTGNCNVLAAAESIGVTASQVHYRRRTSAPFGAQWARAIDAAYHLLEARMLAHVLASGGDTPIPGDGIADPVDWDRALKLLTMRNARREGRGRPSGTPPTVATREQSDTAILAKLKALADRKARLAGQAASDTADDAATPHIAAGVETAP